MNDLCALGLHNAAHNINGNIMPVKQGSCGNDPHLILWSIGHGNTKVIEKANVC
jgi:hypothetical protein